MRAEKNSKTKPQKKTGKRVLKLVLALIVILIVLVFLLVPVFVSSEKGRKIILAQINNSVAGRTDFTDISMGWFKGIKIEDFGFNDNAGQISVQVKQIATKPRYGSILTGNLSFGQTTIDKPRVQINLKELQAPKAPKQKTSATQGPVVLPIKRIDLELNDGSIKVTDSQARTVEVSQINSGLNLRPPGQQTDFYLNMVVAQADKASEIRVLSRITPKQQTGWSLKGTSGNLTIDVNELDLESLAPFFALTGLDIQAEGHVGGRVTSQIKDGRLENLNADIKAKNLDITGAMLKGDRIRTSSLDVSAKLNHTKETINIDKLQVKSDWAFVTTSGVVPTTFKSFADLLEADSNYNLKGVFNCDLAAVLSQMPKTLGLKEGMQITSGQLDGNVETSTQAGQRQFRAQATLAGLEGAMEGKKITLSAPIKAEALISSNKAGINFDKLEVSAPFAKINCTGSTEQLKYNANADLGKLQSELGQFINIGQHQMAGEVLIRGKGQISLKENRVTTSGSTTVKNLRLSSPEGVSATEPMADIIFTLGIDTKQSILSVNSLKAKASLGQVSVQNGVVPLNKQSAKPLDLDISANNVDLNKLQPFAVLFASFPEKMQMAGIAESQLSVTSKKDTYTIKTDSTKISNLKLTSPEREPFIQDQVLFTFDGDFTPSAGNWVVRELKLTSPDIKIKFDFEKSEQHGQTKLDGRLNYEWDWSAVSTLSAPYLPEDLMIQGKRKDTVSFTSEYPTGEPNKIVENLNAKAKVGFEKADYMGLNFGQTDVDIQVQNGLLKIAPLTTTVNEGQLNFAAQGDFKQSPALFKTTKPMQLLKDIKINDRTTKKLLMYLSPIFSNAVNVSGIANFACEQLAIPLSPTAKNQAVVVGTVSISQLRLQASDLLNQILSVARTSARDANITIHPTRFVLQDGFLRYDNMQIDIDNYPVNFKGVIGLDKSLNMMVTLPYTIEGRTVTLGDKDLDRRITLPLKGTVDKPELDMGKLLEQQIQRQLEDQLRKGLEGLLK